MRIAFPLPLVLALALPVQAQDGEDKLPFAPDHTGLDWVLPFKKALAAAKQQDRLLVIKPIAFGTDKNGGW